ncbi:MAG: TonB-dependent receptor [Tannerella sp.]|jgi:TonB-linked SusC/RagA family outer membrane protein|nr:TonB-dependent receptor [Tannerella sp.]
MKKIFHIKRQNLLIIKKTWQQMKLITILLFSATLCLQANITYSQIAKVNLNLENATLTDIFREIEKQSEYRFFYNSTVLNYSIKLNLKTGDKDLMEVLDQLFGNTNMSYKLVDKYIVITHKNDIVQPDLLQISDKKQVTGVVLDELGEPVIGAGVIEKGTMNGIITDAGGRFSLDVGENAILQISYIGYVTQEIPVKNQQDFMITLVEDLQALDEVVVVGYGTQKKITLTGAVASISSKELAVTPVSNTANALAGRLPGLVAIQNSGRPGSDETKLYIRGFNEPLVIVDGVEGSLSNIDPNMIESISILKDGSASIYGARAGHGVVLVTTKRGVQQKPVIILSANISMQGVTAMPRTTNAGQYAELMTEKWLQEGRDPDKMPYTQEQIQKYYANNDPQYPSTNWYDELIRDWSPMQQYNLSIRGGSEKIKYYGFIGHMTQESIWKKNGGGYERYNLQSNIDAAITDNLSFQLDLAVTVGDDITSMRARGGEWGDFWSTLPVYPATLPDPAKISYADGAGTGGAHVSTNYKLFGYDKRNNQSFRGTGSLIYKVPYIAGLTAKLLVNVSMKNDRTKTFIKPVNFYTYDVASDTYTLAGSLGNSAQIALSDTDGRMITTQASLNYDKIFAKDHHLSALALFEGIDDNTDWFSASRQNTLAPSIEQLYAGDTSTSSNDGKAEEKGRMSYVSRVNYSYKEKYLLEATLRADASARFSPSKRWGYFPGILLGWRISEENFLNNINFLDNLKLRVTHGQSGDDGTVNFQYLSGYTVRNVAGYLIGNAPMKVITPSVIPNPNLSWEEIKITDIGIDFSFLNRKIYGEADVFYRERTGIPAKRNLSLPTTFGALLPNENINSLSNRGFELTLGSRFNVSNFMFDLSGYISWARDKWMHYEEQEFTDPDEIRINKKSEKWADIIYGYKSDGLFGSQEEIDALPFQQDNNNNKSLRPGDVRFVDVNGDGQLDWRDQVEIGNKTPHWTTGINLNASYKEFDIAALFQGAFGYYTDVWLIRSTNKVYSEEVYKLRWTEENNNTNALVPRIGGSSLNSSASDYRYKKAGYLRLKSASIGYNIPKSVLRKIFVDHVRVSLSGTNLFTFDKLKKYNIDPEVPFGDAGYYYPQQRTISLGLNMSF